MGRKGKGSRGGKGGTGKHARPSQPAASGPNPLVAGGVVVVVMTLLGVALSFALRAPAPPPSPAPSVVASAEPSPEVSPPPQPTAKPAAKTPAPSPEADPEPEHEPDPEPSTPAVAEPEPVAAPVAAVDGAPATAQIKGETEVVEVKRVIDGDTFDTADGRRIRMVGINTPERDRPFYKEAGNLLRSLISGKKVTLEYDQEKTGRYKRTLAYVHADGVFVTGEIVRRGLAYVYLYPNTKLHNDELVQYQREARAANRVLWSKPLPPPAERYIGNRSAPYFHREGCGRLSKMRKSNRVEFRERNAALDAGMNPCDDCKS